MDTTMRAAMMRLAVLAAAVLGMGAAWAWAAEPPPSQIWLISTRHAPYSSDCGADAAGLGYWRLGADNQWLAADLKGFLAADEPAVPTVVCIHGNRSEEADAVSEGWSLYHILHSLAPNQPMRYVIWSWPAERIGGRNRADVQVKAARSDGQSGYLAQLIRRMNPKVPVSLVGYSFGARIITGAAQLLAGGEVAGKVVPPANPTVQRVPMRAVLVAAAEDYYWLAPNYSHGLALGQMDRVLITVNQADPVLRFYPRLYGRGGPGALGYVSPASGTDTSKTDLLNVTCSVGKSHDWDCYLADPSLRQRLAWYAFLQPAAAEIKPEAAASPLSPPAAAAAAVESPTAADY